MRHTLIPIINFARFRTLPIPDSGVVIIVFIMIVMTLTNLPLIILPTYVDGKCKVTSNHLTKFLTVGIKAAFYGYIPILAIFIFNSITIAKISPWDCHRVSALWSTIEN